MATYKNNTGFPQSVARDGIEYNVADGATVEVPDEDVSFEGRPGWSKSQVKSPDVAIDADTVPADTVPAPTPAAPTN